MQGSRHFCVHQHRYKTHKAAEMWVPSCVHFSTSASQLTTFCSADLLGKHVWPMELGICFSAHVVLGRGGAVGKTRARRAAGLSRDPPIQTTVRAHGHTWALRLCAAALSVSGLVVLAERRTLVASRPHGASQTHIWARASTREGSALCWWWEDNHGCPLYPLPNRPTCSLCQAEQNTRDIQNTAFFLNPWWEWIPQRFHNTRVCMATSPGCVPAPAPPP